MPPPKSHGKEDDDLEDLLNTLEVASKPNTTTNDRKANPGFKQALESCPFTIFESIADLGYFGWIPKGPYKVLSKVDSTKEITDKIDLSTKPNTLVDIKKLNQMLPKRFERLSPQTHMNKYPYSHPYIASLHVAVKYRGIDLDDIDFVFGGSTLGTLASNETDDSAQYFATLVPYTKKSIMVVKIKEYEQDYSVPGFQFERFVTGRKFSDKHDVSLVEHLHIMKNGKYKVLFSGETDAMNDDGPIEVSTSNPRYWGTKKMFQMLSNGSIGFCAGTKGRGELRHIKVMTLSEVTKDALSTAAVASLEKNVLQNMDQLKSSLDGTPKTSSPLELSFKTGKMELTLRKHDKLLPSDAVVEKLLKI